MPKTSCSKFIPEERKLRKEGGKENKITSQSVPGSQKGPMQVSASRASAHSSLTSPSSTPDTKWSAQMAGHFSLWPMLTRDYDGVLLMSLSQERGNIMTLQDGI